MRERGPVELACRVLFRSADRTGPLSRGVRGGAAESEVGFRAQRIRVREAEFAGDGQRPGPGGAGRVVDGAVVGVAEAGETDRLATPVTGPVEQVERLPVAVEVIDAIAFEFQAGRRWPRRAGAAESGEDLGVFQSADAADSAA